MTQRHWMPLYIADYLADTAHLSTTEHGAYLLLIMHYWTKGSLPKEEESIRRVTRMTVRQWSRSRDLLRSLFGADWSHKRCDHEIAQAVEKSKVNSANARRSHVIRTANAQRTHTQSQSQSKSLEEVSKIDAPPTAAQRVAKRALPLPIGWQPSVRAFELAEQHGQNVQVVESIFRDYLASSGKLYRDYDAAFHNFIRNQQSFNRGGSSNGVRQNSGISSACDKLIAIARANYHGESTQDPSGFGAHEDTARILPYRRS